MLHLILKMTILSLQYLPKVCLNPRLDPNGYEQQIN